MARKEYYFEDAPVSKAIVSFGVPVMTAMLAITLYNIIDTVFIGMLGDYRLIAAAALAQPLFLVYMGAAKIFAVGGGSFISRLLGKKDYETTKQVCAFCFYGILISGAVFSITGLAFLEPILRVLGAASETIEPTREYVSIVIAGFIPSMLSLSLAVIIRSEGGVKSAMIGNIIGTAVNIVLDPVFIFLFGWGLRGAAISTVIANILGALYYARYIISRSFMLSLRLGDFRISREISGQVFAIGIPAFLYNLITIVSSLVQNNCAAAFGGLYVAVFGILFRLTLLPKMLCSGLCDGVQPLIGYNYAAKNLSRLKEILRKTCLYATVIGVFFACAFFTAGSAPLRAFINDPDIISAGTPLARIVIISLPAYGFIFVIVALFQSAGKAVPAAVISLSQGAVCIPAVLLLAGFFGVQGFAWALPAADSITALIGGVLYFRNRKSIYADEASA